jgi:hypothetical protein
MPMPKSHLTQSTKLSATFSELAKVAPKSLSSLSKLVRDPQLLTVVNELHDNDEERRKASKNATAYLKRRGVNLPKGMVVRLVDNNWSMSFCIHGKSKTGVDWTWGFHYDSEAGWGWGC